MASVTVTNFANQILMWLPLIGLFTGLIRPYTAAWIMTCAWGVIMLFNLVTLPVEFDASSRAKDVLAACRFIAPGAEAAAVKKVLDAAAWTYSPHSSRRSHTSSGTCCRSSRATARGDPHCHPSLNTNTKTMRLTVQHFSVASTDRLDSWVERQILALGRHRQIDAAIVQLARRIGRSPSFEAKVQLVTPGPDLFAEGIDHTLRAAFAKAMSQLEGEISRRVVNRARRERPKTSVRPRG